MNLDAAERERLRELAKDIPSVKYRDSGTVWLSILPATVSEQLAALPAALDRIDALERENTLLKGAIQAQDNREKAAGDKCGVPWHESGCDWPDDVAEYVLALKSASP